MKKLILPLSIALLVFTNSCKDETKPVKEATTVEASTNQFVVKPEATSVKWTAYKTTEKKPVGGEFLVLKFDEKSGKSPEEALNGLNFSIPVSSLFTNDASNTRDAKIKTYFFKEMLDTDLIKGSINYINNSYVASITMNGVTKNLPLDIKITDERRVKLTGTMFLKDWNALDALASLNKVCLDLHKGADGISKTWEEVSIEVNTFLREN